MYLNNLVIFKIIFLLYHNVLCYRPYSITNLNVSTIKEDTNWILKDLQNYYFKQVPGIAVNKTTLSIFHRSSVVWNQFSFNEREVYMRQDQPITVDAILNFNLDGNLIGSWGKNLFFMPHGLSYDNDGNAWTTDVALHQVFRFNKNDLKKPDLVLGQRFVPGDDASHFCKPTDVQVSSETKLVYISDGYCNRRIVVFDYEGKFVKQFGLNENMFVSHSLSLIESLDLVCVADRENNRVLCYNAGLKDQNKLGELRKEFKTSSNLDNSGAMFAIQNKDNYLFAVIWYRQSERAEGVLFDLSKDSNELVWQNILNLNQPHDIAVDEHNFYIAEIDPNSSKLVKKFNITNLVQTQATTSQLKVTTMQGRALQYLNAKSKRIDDTNLQEEDLKNLAAITTTTQSPKADSISLLNANSNSKAKRSSLLLFIVFISSLLLISIILFVLKKRVGIENYFRNLGLPTKVFYSKDLHINDPERCGFNLLREEEENLFDFELENNSSDESEVEEFNFKHVRKV